MTQEKIPKEEDFEDIPPEKDGKMDRETYVLSSEIKSWWVHSIMQPLENFCVRHQVSPNMITIFAVILCVLCFFLYARGHFLSGGWILLLAGSLDFLDGRVARATGRESKAGAFLDSVADRYQDFLVFAGLAVVYRDSWIFYLVLLALGGALFTPYIRAKGDSLGVDLAKVGTFQRPERIFLLGFGSLVSSVFQIGIMPFYEKGTPPPQHILILILMFMAVATNWTAMSRIRHVMNELTEKESS